MLHIHITRAKYRRTYALAITIALIIGLIIVNVVQPGAGMNVDPSTLDAKAVAVYAEQAKDQGVVAFLLDVIPGSVIGAWSSLASPSSISVTQR